jgi:signal transduction histidine kinase/ActR/RegA family two-component response regulator
VDLTEIPGVWLSWWVGDTLGALVLVPMAQVIRNSSDSGRLSRAAWVLVPTLVAAAVTSVSFFVIRHLEYSRTRDEFIARATTVGQAIGRQLAGQVHIVEALRGFIESSTEIDHADFQHFAKRLLADSPGVQSISWAPLYECVDGRVSPLAPRHMGPQPVRPFSILDPTGSHLDCPPDGFAAIITQIAPDTAANRRARGLVLNSRPAVDEALFRARLTSAPAASAPLELVQSAPGELGFGIYAPVYDRLQSASPHPLIGYCGIASRAGALLSELVDDRCLDWFSVTLLDVSNTGGAVTMARITQLPGAEHPPDNQWTRDVRLEVPILLAGRELVLKFDPTRSFFAQSRFLAGGGALAGGMLFTALLEAFMMLTTGRTEVIRDLVRQRTSALEREVEQRRQLEQEAARARARAEELAAAKGRFLAHMSHELRTPLNAIIGMAGYLAEQSLQTDAAEAARIIQRSSIGLLEIVNDVLDFSAIEAGKLTITARPFTLADTVADVIHLFDQQARAKGIDLQLEMGSNLPSTLMGDNVRLRQILINLIGNSLKFTEFGSVALRVRLLRRTDQDCELEFIVADTGIGIPADLIGHLFEPFSRLESKETSERQMGTGLGLAISREIAQRMGGSLELESEPNRGTVARVILPFTIPRGRDLLELTGSLSRLRVLVAEDIPVNRLITRRLLETIGVARIVEAVDGQEAIALASSEPLDVILMDCQMPVVDGLTATRRLRALGGRAAKIPIIALTANSIDEVRPRCIEAGMNDCLCKPIELDGLRQALLRAISRPSG